MLEALITGVTGQDGSYLAEYLLSLGYRVHGVQRVTSVDNCERVRHLLPNPNFVLHYGDIGDSHSIRSIMHKVMPDEVYNLAAQSHVGNSFKVAEQTGNVTGLGVLRVLDAILDVKPTAKFYQASSSELFGKVQETPQRETTPFYPRSPYGAAKMYGYWITVNYRESYGLHASNGILFNHESPRRGEEFVTRKIVKQLVEVYKRQRTHIELGNLDAKRDWGFAGDYVKAMHKMLQMDKPGDYVIATGETHSVREFVEEVCRLLHIELCWMRNDSPVDELGINFKTGDTLVKINPAYYRPAEVDILIGDPTKAKEVLGWEATTKFKDLVKMMVEAEL